MLRAGLYEGRRRVAGSTGAPVMFLLDKELLRLTLPLPFEDALYLTEEGWEARGNALAKGRCRVVRGRKYLIVEARLQPSTLEELKRLAATKCKFIAQLVCKHRPALRIIARRETSVELRLPLFVVGCDLNSHHGLVVRGFEVTEESARLVFRKRYKPPNHGRRRRLAAELQSIGRYKEASAVRRREKGLNTAWEKGVVADVRKVIWEHAARGFSAVIAVDAPDSGSLGGSPLQGTLLRVLERVRNMAAFEGAAFVAVRVSGKRCPLCGTKGEECGHRRYRCRRCGVVWQRDSMAAIVAAVAAMRVLGMDDAVKRVQGWLRGKAEKNGDLAKL